MILSHQNKFVFLRVPKTGSTSVFAHILNRYGEEIEMHANEDLINVSSKNCNYGPHVTLDNLVQDKIIKNINDYKIYGIIRDPIDRFISIAKYVHADLYPNIDNNTAVKFALLKIDKYYLNNNKGVDALSYARQIDFFKSGTKIYDKNLYTYENINKFIIDLCGTDSKIKNNYRSDVRKDKTINIKQEYVDQIIDLYDEDYQLYNRLKSCES